MTRAKFEPTSTIEVSAGVDVAVLTYRSVIDIAVGGGGGHLECWQLNVYVYVHDRHGWRCKWSQATDTIVD